MGLTHWRRMWRLDGGGPALGERDELAAEEPLEIRVRGRSVSVTMRTPGHDDELAAGFLVTEAVIRGTADVIRIEQCAADEQGNVVNVTLAPEVPLDLARLTRHVFASSSCGLCGKASIDSVHTQFDPITTNLSIGFSTLRELPARLRRAQPAFEQTGGVHAAAVFGPDGGLVVVREDVGRHNAVDKVIGFGLLQGLLPFERHVLVVSGRASFEIMQKALAARIPIVAAVSAPSSLAAEFAERSSQTLIGFLRDHRMNVYANPQRITLP